MTSFFNRGGAWVLWQMLLFVCMAVMAPRWRAGGFHPVIVIGGAALLCVSAGIALAGLAALGRNLTPFPKPSERSRLVRHGIYGVVRHPIYVSVIVGGIGWAMVWQSWPALLPAVALIPLLQAKARREERWLREKFPEYVEYESRVGRFLPRF